MPGPNLTGTPNTRDYVLGRGRIYFGELNADGSVEGIAWRDLGNGPAFSTSINEETLKHKSSRSGVSETDAEVTISKEGTYSFTLDEFNHENLAALFSGTQDTPVNAAADGFLAASVIASVQKGRWYEITDADGVRAYNIDADDLTVNITGGAELVEGTDYTVDETWGMVFFLTTGVTLDNGDGIDFELDPGTATNIVDAVDGFTRANVKGALKIILVNVQDNSDEQELVILRTSMKANGDTAFIGDDWGTMQFTGTIETNSVYGKSMWIRRPR